MLTVGGAVTMFVVLLGEEIWAMESQRNGRGGQGPGQELKRSKENKVCPDQAVKIESVVNCAAVHKGMKSNSNLSSRPSTLRIRTVARK